MSRVSAEEFTLDTKSMGQAADQCKQLSEKMKELRRELEIEKNELMSVWAGEGRDEFECQYRVLNQKFSDIIDDTWDMFENIMTAYETYVKADTEAAKALDGVDNRF